jgi:hypothetical protein
MKMVETKLEKIEAFLEKRFNWMNKTLPPRDLLAIKHKREASQERLE